MGSFRPAALPLTASCLVYVLLLARIEYSSAQSKRWGHTKHRSTAVSGDEGAEPLGLQVGANPGSGAFQREEQKQSAVPMEAAEAHFHLLPSRPSLEVSEEDENEDLGEVVPTAKTSARASVKAPTPVKAPKKSFGHHGGKPGLPFCTMEGMGQIPKVTGKWVDHPSSNHLGYYDPRTECPSYAEDFNCLRPYPPAQINEELAAREYRKVFLADQCQLRHFDAAGFEACMTGRRLFLIGDSLMRQQFASLACLLKKVSTRGFSGKWDETNYTHQGEYFHKWGPDRKIQVSKQFVGDFTLKNGAQVIIRSFGTYESELWDDVFSEFEPITSDDIILVNFAAWYPKYKITEPFIPYEQWEEDMAALFRDKLSKSDAQVVWKDYSPSHFSGATGTFSGIDESLPGVPAREKCEPASVGEFWYGDWVRTYINSTCGAACDNIRVLPIFDLSLPRHDAHHGSFGRGRFDDKTTDCRHFCNPVVDMWNTVFYNMMCG